GFVGVDAFFVLSGFLITGLILREHERTGRIDLAAFYARRVRRILPAALLTVAVTVGFAALVLAPLDVPNVALDGAAAALSVGNIRFAMTSIDYFGPASPSPFRHFWSLGVEEQFYLVWPTLLGLAVWRGGSRRRVVVVLAAVVGASLALSVWLTGVDAPVAFYSLPTRAWQLGLGGLLAAGASRPAPLAGAVPLARTGGTVTADGLPRASFEDGIRAAVSRLSVWLRARLVAAAWAGVALVGLAAIVASTVLLDGSTPYPGTAAIVPAVATAAVILGGQRQGPARWLLVRRPVRWLGRISYSLYLWHWPILVLPALALGRDLEPVEVVPLAALSVAVGWASWRFVEEPFRRGWSPSVSRRRTVLAGLSAAALVAVVALSVGNGVLLRLPASAYGSSTSESAAGSRGAPDAADFAAPERQSYESLVGGAGTSSPGAPPSAAPPAPVNPATASPASPDPTSAATASPITPATATSRPSAIPAPAYSAPTGAVPLSADVAPPLTAARNDMDPLVADGCGLALDGSTPPICVYGRRDGAVTVALVGDSHADHWFPALLRIANQEGWRLIPLTKYSCPFVDERIWSRWLQREYTECEAWRPKVVAALQRLKPDLTIVSGHRWFQTIVAGDDDPVRMGQAEARLLAQVPGRIVVLADTPIARVDVPACLSAHLADIRACASDRGWAFGYQPGLRDRTAARLVGAAYLSMNDAICPGSGPCPAVLRGMIVYRDDHHMTATFARSLAPLLEARLLAIDPALAPVASAPPGPTGQSPIEMIAA
ncbi:MAG TPA: acyltransferase family protein, partial [Candidatus Limnocylindrales bacterium]